MVLTGGQAPESAPGRETGGVRKEGGGGVTREDSGTASVRLHSFSISRTLRAFAKASAH